MSQVGEEYEEAGAVRVRYGSMDQPGAPMAAAAPVEPMVIESIPTRVVAPSNMFRNFSVSGSEDGEPGMLEPGQSPLLSTHVDGGHIGEPSTWTHAMRGGVRLSCAVFNDTKRGVKLERC